MRDLNGHFIYVFRIIIYLVINVHNMYWFLLNIEEKKSIFNENTEFIILKNEEEMVNVIDSN